MALTLLGVLCAILLFAHSAVGMGHDSGADDQAMQDAMTVCLAVVQIAGSVALLIATPFPLLGRRTACRGNPSGPMIMAASVQPAVAARAGPAVLQVFRL